MTASTTSPHLAHAHEVWRRDVLPALIEYMRIPNVSAHFDADWKAHGYMDAAVELVAEWCRQRTIAGLSLEVQELAGRSPLIVIDVPAFGANATESTVLLYGHLDKQPEMTGWRDGLGPWTPVIEGDRLYGRGGADDGYAAFAALTAIESVQRHGGSHGRCIVLIEASEESGSPDLPAHLAALGERLGTPELVVCLDSGAMDYDRMWVTTSLRGMVACRLTVQVLDEGVHSGEASGIVPSSFRIARLLLDRLEDATTGRMLLPELHVEIPPDRIAEATTTAAEFPQPIATHFPLHAATLPMWADAADQLLAHTWHPTLSVVGVDGFPPIDRAGNVLRPYTTLKLSIRLAPTCDADAATAAIVRALTTDVPYGATATVTHIERASGWNAPATAPWLAEALDSASTATFGVPARHFGEGGSIPFMGMLGEQFPEAQFVITGALGPGNNAHGPNEFLHLPTAERITASISHLLDAHAARR